MFDAILVANRGEIACRVIRTLRRLGIRSVAVCSEVDRHALFTRLADEVIELGPAPARDSYLRADKILEAARRTGAQAIHPGYGFLSENAGFAAACAEAGVRFIGPSPSAISAMGMKDAAKTLMERAGVPVVPGYHGDAQDLDTLQAEARRVGYPVLIKAVAGGGGKGMRRVDTPEEFAAALAGARREALGAFGDERVLIEKYLTRPRHIEVQVFADCQGNVVHLFERDCSLQRRHQKVLEEAPAPFVSAAMRSSMGEAAVRAARAIGYEGAGTVEFIADVESGLDPERFYFMEMNTRLQVEHPVTELITGLDLVEWQVRVAAGEPLPWSQSEIKMRGHAMEARLYAEDPERDYLPQTGELIELALPDGEALSFARGQGVTAHVRVDAGVVAGDTVSVFYDPMIAKLIAWGEDRAEALRRLRAALAQVEVLGLATNAWLLSRIAAHPAFVAAQVHTGFLVEHEASLSLANEQDEEERHFAWVLACIGLLGTRVKTAAKVQGDPWSPWGDLKGFRVDGSRSESLWLRTGEHTLDVSVDYSASGFRLMFLGRHFEVREPFCSGTRVSGLVNGRRISGRYAERGDVIHVAFRGRGLVVLHPRAALETSRAEADESERVVKAPMPGKIIGLLVRAGERIQKGTPLVRLEAMKMEHTLKANLDGSVFELLAREGDQVEAGSTLLVLKAHEEVAP